jgi:uncharacterized protein YecE (DUF72 family)
MLERHRCCWVTADFSREPAAIMPTADFHYVRWLGEHGRYTQTKETPVDVSQRLEWWAERLKRSAVESGISTTWGFFNHDYSGFAIGDVRRMRTMVGLSETDTPQDPTLFA